MKFDIINILVHDLCIMEILKQHNTILEASFGPKLIELRNSFSFGPSEFSVAAKLGLINWHG